VERWPFIDLLPSKTYYHTIGDEQREGVALGQVMSVRDERVKFMAYLGGVTQIRTNLCFDSAEQAAPWRQLAGVGMALAVTRHELYIPDKPMYAVDKILAVEPSLNSPYRILATALGSVLAAGLGYMHGTVRAGEPKHPHDVWSFDLDPPGIVPDVSIHATRQQTVLSNGFTVDALEPGDQVRVRVSSANSLGSYIAMGPIHLLLGNPMGPH
jgi:hypothetical protein